MQEHPASKRFRGDVARVFCKGSETIGRLLKMLNNIYVSDFIILAHGKLEKPACPIIVSRNSIDFDGNAGDRDDKVQVYIRYDDEGELEYRLPFPSNHPMDRTEFYGRARKIVIYNPVYAGRSVDLILVFDESVRISDALYDLVAVKDMMLNRLGNFCFLSASKDQEPIDFRASAPGENDE
jgi:hypothetical protein